MTATAADRSVTGSPTGYLDSSARDDRLSGGVRIIPIATPHGRLKVWRTLPQGRYLDCADGSHMAMYDDQQRYFDGLIRFLTHIDGGR
jgi:hypothetical protein